MVVVVISGVVLDSVEEEVEGLGLTMSVVIASRVVLDALSVNSSVTVTSEEDIDGMPSGSTVVGAVVSSGSAVVVASFETIFEISLYKSRSIFFFNEKTNYHFINCVPMFSYLSVVTINCAHSKIEDVIYTINYRTFKDDHSTRQSGS